MGSKICIITGVTSGMGLATAMALARQGYTLGIVCRNEQKGKVILETIKKNTSNDRVTLFIADLSVISEIRKIAAEIYKRFPAIDILINNAGVINPVRILTVDGYESTFALNHLGYFLLTILLMPALKAAPKGRIVSVASQAGMIGSIHFDDLHFNNGYSSMKAYAQSKLANIMFTYELARKLSGSTVTANCLHPGVVRTNFGKELKGFLGWIFKKFTGLMRTAEKGAETIIWLATSPDVEGISGKYFKDKKEIRSNKSSYDIAFQQRLWQVSEQLCGLQ